MFPKKNRIVSAKDIKTTLYSKFKNRTKYFTITTRKTINLGRQNLGLKTNLSNFKILVIISKKISKRSNIRNKIRRRILAIFDQYKFQNILPDNIWLALQITNPEIINLSFVELETQVFEHTKHIFIKPKIPNLQ